MQANRYAQVDPDLVRYPRREPVSLQRLRRSQLPGLGLWNQSGRWYCKLWESHKAIPARTIPSSPDPCEPQIGHAGAPPNHPRPRL